MYVVFLLEIKENNLTFVVILGMQIDLQSSIKNMEICIEFLTVNSSLTNLKIWNEKRNPFQKLIIFAL